MSDVFDIVDINALQRMNKKHAVKYKELSALVGVDRDKVVSLCNLKRESNITWGSTLDDSELEVVLMLFKSKKFLYRSADRALVIRLLPYSSTTEKYGLYAKFNTKYVYLKTIPTELDEAISSIGMPIMPEYFRIINYIEDKLEEGKQLPAIVNTRSVKDMLRSCKEIAKIDQYKLLENLGYRVDKNARLNNNSRAILQKYVCQETGILQLPSSSADYTRIYTRAVSFGFESVWDYAQSLGFILDKPLEQILPNTFDVKQLLKTKYCVGNNKVYIDSTTTFYRKLSRIAKMYGISVTQYLKSLGFERVRKVDSNMLIQGGCKD